MKDLLGMMGKVREMQARMVTVQEELAQLKLEGRSGGGLVKATLSGKGDLTTLVIDPALMQPDDAGIVADLVVSAVADAKAKLESILRDKMQDVTGGLPIPPGLKLF